MTAHARVIAALVWVALLAATAAVADSAVPRRAGIPAESAARTVAERVHADLARGEDVVVASYVGLWYEHGDDPARNLYWGQLYGHRAMFRRPREIRAMLPFLERADYLERTRRRRTGDPLEVLVLTSGGGTRGRLIVVTLAYSDMQRAVHDMALHLKSGAIPAALADDAEVAPLLGRAYVVGYWGHNVYYGGSPVDALERVPVSTNDLPRGAFFVGCQSARWFPQKFLGTGIEPLLFTTTNMAPEAYVALALYDGLARGLSPAAIGANVAEAYRVYQKLRRPPQGLFVNDRARIDRLAQPLPVD